ncbi:unnamed protein product [Prunus armeniaca]
MEIGKGRKVSSLKPLLDSIHGSQNDLTVSGQSPVFSDVLRGEALNITYEINNTIYQNGYYVADGIYPRWTTFVKSIPHPLFEKQNYLLPIKRVTKKKWRGVLVLRSIMMTCIILHNMIVEDEYDYNDANVYRPDPMNTALIKNL